MEGGAGQETCGGQLTQKEKEMKNEYLTDREVEEILERNVKKVERPELLSGVLPIYEHKESRYPDRIRVSFFDGTTVLYDIHVEQPEFSPALKDLERMKPGYVNKPARRRRRK